MASFIASATIRDLISQKFSCITLAGPLFKDGENIKIFMASSEQWFICLIFNDMYNYQVLTGSIFGMFKFLVFLGHWYNIKDEQCKITY